LIVSVLPELKEIFMAGKVGSPTIVTSETTLPERRARVSINVRRLRRHPTVVAGLSILFLILLASLLEPWLTPYNPLTLDVVHRLHAPDAHHYFGTDSFGRDVFSRVLYGGRISLLIGAAVTIVAVGGGTVIGLITGYFRKIDPVVMRVSDGLMAFPSIMLAIALRGAMGPGLLTVVIALGIAYLPRVVRIIRGAAIVLREQTFVQAADAVGSGTARILFQHILPNAMGLVLVQTTFIFSYAVLGEAALDFLGVGVPPELPSWGGIMSEGRTYIVIAPWLTLFAGLIIMVAVLALNLTGDGLRDMLDPRLRKLK
jgi:peptide/nickel transport system permease protein